MKPLLTIHVPITDNRISLNHLIKQAGISQALRRRLRTDGVFLFNGNPITWDTIFTQEGWLEVFYTTKQSLTAWNFPLSIAYEDEHIVVINKPPGILMHPTSSERLHTIANALVYYFEHTQQQATFHPIHRLDKDTSGLVVIAKNAMVQHAFTKMHKPHQKVYDALVEGYVPFTKATVQWPIVRKEGSIIERTVHPQGKPAHTDIICKARSQRLSWLQYTLHTGRTHQIRVHSAQLGYPLLGDDLYGGSLTILSRQALHASHLSFVHPVTKEPIQLDAPLPNDMESVIKSYHLDGS